MITEIGIVAGDIWHYLDEQKTAYLKDIVPGIGKERNVILMSLGWLAREGHVIMEQEGNDYKVSLRF